MKGKICIFLQCWFCGGIFLSPFSQRSQEVLRSRSIGQELFFLLWYYCFDWCVSPQFCFLPPQKDLRRKIAKFLWLKVILFLLQETTVPVALQFSFRTTQKDHRRKIIKVLWLKGITNYFFFFMKLFLQLFCWTVL